MDFFAFASQNARSEFRGANTMKRRDLLSEGGRMLGQCFLCGRVSRLAPKFDSSGAPVYECWNCGGANSPTRVEDGLDIHGQPLREARS